MLEVIRNLLAADERDRVTLIRRVWSYLETTSLQGPVIRYADRGPHY